MEYQEIFEEKKVEKEEKGREEMVKEEEKIRICVLDLIPEGVSDMEALAGSDFIRGEVENIEYF